MERFILNTKRERAWKEEKTKITVEPRGVAHATQSNLTRLKSLQKKCSGYVVLTSNWTWNFNIFSLVLFDGPLSVTKYKYTREITWKEGKHHIYPLYILFLIYVNTINWLHVTCVALSSSGSLDSRRTFTMETPFFSKPIIPNLLLWGRPLKTTLTTSSLILNYIS